MKKFLLVIVSVIIGLLFFKLTINYSEKFENINKAYKSNQCVNLVKGSNTEKDLEKLLITHNYVSDKKDAEFIAKQIALNLNKGQELSNLYDLNKRVWQVPATLVDSCFSDSIDNAKNNGKTKEKDANTKESTLKKRLTFSQEKLGIDSSFSLIKIEQLKHEMSVGNGKGNGRITAIVTEKDSTANFIKQILHIDKKPCKDVIVRLSVHYLDSTHVNLKAEDSVLCYAKTDKNGVATFTNLDPNKSYSVLPIKRGYEYGSPKGTIGGNLAKSGDNNSISCPFTQQEHKIRLFDATTLKVIKEDQTMTVRTPETFENTLITYLAIYFALWWALYLFNTRKKKSMDVGILSILMLLTGTCILTMFSINDPLTDKLLGVDMAQGVYGGIAIIWLLQYVDFVKLYQGHSRVAFDIPLDCIKWIFKPFRTKVSYLAQILSDRKKNFIFKSLALVGVVLCLPFILLDLIQLTRLNNKISNLLDKLPKGSGYILAALILTLLLFTPLGASVGGMKVNLNVGILFQPSEIAKYLVIFFMAAYFCRNANNIVKYSEEGNVKLFGAKMKMLWAVIIGLLVLMAIYFVLGDMGPALVLAFTFIILYSIIKSKIDLSKVEKSKRPIKVLTCDLAWLIYGILSFLTCLYLGYLWGGNVKMVITSVIWFIVWIALGYNRKQIFETAIIFNIIICAFVFGPLLSDVPGLGTVAKRLADRNEMCTNTWGTLPIDGATPDAGENTQVAEGLWGLASGGLTGQGLGNGTPHAIPAFHTDMVLESMGEQLGLFSIISIIIIMALLMRRTIVIGYRTSHPFAFYLCLGIAIVTAVQFIIISLGSTGLVPLTGVTVPFFSYGKVSMILNLTAFGIILSISKRNSLESLPKDIAEIKVKDMNKYSHSVALLSIAYTIFAIFLCSVFVKYQFIERDEILVRPVYVNSSSGIPVINYNPRISLLTRKLPSGDIYDRNGILLATSDKKNISKHKDAYASLGLETCDTSKLQSRYYPFGDHLFFMLGDFNNRLFFSSSDTHARGYMAEARHLDTLRGFDNTRYDAKNNPVLVPLKSEEYRPDKYFEAKSVYTTENNVVIRDYSALVELLKDGYYYYPHRQIPRNIVAKYQDEKLNAPSDIHLTLDAKLQMNVEQGLANFIEDKKNKGIAERNNKIRASVVILDAKNGDLLTSVNYPMVNMEILKDKDLPKSYSNIEKNASIDAYIDMDLGLFHATAPGSTAKVMSAIAGLKADINNRNEKYRVYREAYVGAEHENVLKLTDGATMEDALVWSSNVYFINLVNDKNLYDELADVYSSAGIFINAKKPYILHYNTYDPNSNWKSNITKEASNATAKYQKYKNYVDKRDFPNMKRCLSDGIWQWAWGQGSMDATPLAMARIASIPANNGKMPITRYLLNEKISDIPIITNDAANYLSSYMKSEAEIHMINVAQKHQSLKDRIGGKTGTAERNFSLGSNNEMNDAWYICYINDVNIKTKDSSTTSPIAIAVRIERVKRSSKLSKEFVRDYLLDIINNIGYSF